MNRSEQDRNRPKFTMKAYLAVTALMFVIGSSTNDNNNNVNAMATTSSPTASDFTTTTSDAVIKVPTTSTTLFPGEVDMDSSYAASTFPIRPTDLIERARDVTMNPSIQTGTKDGGACLAPDFEFVAAVVGPIPREEYLEALNSFQLETSFSIASNFFGFTVDPIQTNRVWFFSRQVAKHIAPFMGAQPRHTKDDGVLTLPPQVMHMDFNADGLVKEFGFYTVDRRQGNTGGLGGAFGYFYGVGKPLPIPECQPYKPSFRFRSLQYIGKLAKMFSNKKKK